MTKANSNTDTRTLEGTRYLLTVKNETNRLYDKGSLVAGTEVVCLRKQESGYYVPCVAFVVDSKPQGHNGRITVDLYDDRSERVTVSSKAILWPTAQPHLVDTLLEILGNPGITETTYGKLRAATDTRQDVIAKLYNIAVSAEDVLKLWQSPVGCVTGQDDPGFGAPMTHLRQSLNDLYRQAGIETVSDLKERL